MTEEEIQKLIDTRIQQYLATHTDYVDKQIALLERRLLDRIVFRERPRPRGVKQIETKEGGSDGA